METTQRRKVHLEDVSDEEDVTTNPNHEPKVEQDEERLMRVLSRANAKPVFEVACFDGRLETNAVLDWIFEMEKYFKYEGTPDNKKVKIIVTKLKGHGSLWWDHLQIDRQKRGKEKIKTWMKMLGKMEKEVSPCILPS